MAQLIEVTSSGSVGKQVFATTKPVILKGFLPPAGTSGAFMIIRDGNASGEVKLHIGNAAAVGVLSDFGECGVRFDKGMHVKVTGDDITAGYLLFD